jgi:hypothetical protein
MSSDGLVEWKSHTADKGTYSMSVVVTDSTRGSTAIDFLVKLSDTAPEVTNFRRAGTRAADASGLAFSTTLVDNALKVDLADGDQCASAGGCPANGASRVENAAMALKKPLNTPCGPGIGSFKLGSQGTETETEKRVSWGCGALRFVDPKGQTGYDKEEVFYRVDPNPFLHCTLLGWI